MLKTLPRILLSIGFVALVLAMSVYVATWSPSYQECQTNSTEKAHAQKEKGANSAIPVIDRIGILTNCEGVFANDNGGAMTGIATVLLTLATGLLAYLAWDQGHNSRAQLRAYVSIVSFSISRLNETLRLNIEVLNSGETPAFRPVITLRTALVQAGATSPTTFQNEPVTLQGITIRRGGNSVSFHEAPLDDASWERFRDAVVWMWIIGTVTYFDVFDRKRTTHFKVHAEGMRDLSAHGFIFSEDGNDTT